MQDVSILQNHILTTTITNTDNNMFALISQKNYFQTATGH